LPTIESSLEINADPRAVYEVARDVERFPDYMPQVKSIRVRERSDDNSVQVVEWAGIIPQFALTVKWVERDLWDDQELTCRFEQVAGEFNRYDGLWRFVPDGGGCRFESQLNYELEIPTIGPLIRGVVRKIMAANVDSLQTAIKKRVEGGAAPPG